MKHSSAAAAIRWLAVCACALLLPTATVHETTARQPDAQTPQQFFGFRIGTDGELARYPKILEYFQHLAKTTNRVKYQELGKTTMGNPYVLATISAPENLAKLDRLIAINRRLADPRGLTEAEARKLAQEGRAFYLRLRDDPFDRGRQHASAHRDRPSARDRRQRRDSTDARQRRAPRRAFTESGRPGARHRSLVQDEGHAVRAGVSGPLSQVRRT